MSLKLRRLVRREWGEPNTVFVLAELSVARTARTESEPRRGLSSRPSPTVWLGVLDKS